MVLQFFKVLLTNYIMKITFNKLTVPKGYIYISLDDGNTYDKVNIDDIKNNNNSYSLSDTQDYSKIKIKSNSTIISNLDVIKSISTVRGSYSNDDLEYLSYLAKGKLKSNTTSNYPSVYQIRSLDDGTSIIYMDPLRVPRDGKLSLSALNTAILTTPYIRRFVFLDVNDYGLYSNEYRIIIDDDPSLFNYKVMEPVHLSGYKLCIPEYFTHSTLKSGKNISMYNPDVNKILYLYMDSEKKLFFNPEGSLAYISMKQIDKYNIRYVWEDDTHFIVTDDSYGPINTRYMVVD